MHVRREATIEREFLIATLRAGVMQAMADRILAKLGELPMS